MGVVVTSLWMVVGYRNCGGYRRVVLCGGRVL